MSQPQHHDNNLETQQTFVGGHPHRRSTRTRPRGRQLVPGAVGRQSCASVKTMTHQRRSKSERNFMLPRTPLSPIQEEYRRASLPASFPSCVLSPRRGSARWSSAASSRSSEELHRPTRKASVENLVTLANSYSRTDLARAA